MTPIQADWSAPNLPPLPDLDAMARIADAGARLCERMTIAGLDFVDGLVLLSSRQAEALAGERSFDGFWRAESELVKVWGSQLIDSARECGDAFLTPAASDSSMSDSSPLAVATKPVAKASAAPAVANTDILGSVSSAAPLAAKAQAKAASERASTTRSRTGSTPRSKAASAGKTDTAPATVPAAAPSPKAIRASASKATSGSTPARKRPPA